MEIQEGGTVEIQVEEQMRIVFQAWIFSKNSKQWTEITINYQY